jgi:hypothetical protein
MLDFCGKHGIRVDHVGKVIVATEQAELPRLQTLYERGVANGVPVEMIDPGSFARSSRTRTRFARSGRPRPRSSTTRKSARR